MSQSNLSHLADHQPESLKVFFGTEMWERYGFYVVQALLALYLTSYFHWQDEQIYMLVGSFTALTYISPLIGGWIADNLIGQKRGVSLGCIVLLVSYAILSMTNSKNGLIACLSGIALGTGLLKPNISSLLGNVYPEGSRLRERGFTLFYMGITSGIILGTTLPSIIARHFNWGGAFASAVLGLFFAFMTFRWGCRRYKIEDYTSRALEFNLALRAGLIMIAVWVAAFIILCYPRVADILFDLVVLLTGVYIVYTLKREEITQARQTAVIGVLCFISVLFWAFYFQMFMSLTLFINRVAEHQLLGITFPAPYYVAVESFGMLFFGVFFAKKKFPSDPKLRGIATSKSFLSAMVATMIAMGLIVLVCYSTHPAVLISPWLLLPSYLILAFAELKLSPVGLSAITWLAARNRVSTMMGIFFVSLGFGGFLSGKIAAISAIGSENVPLIILKAQYTHAFTVMFGLLGLATLMCCFFHRYIRYLLK